MHWGVVEDCALERSVVEGVWAEILTEGSPLTYPLYTKQVLLL